MSLPESNRGCIPIFRLIVPFFLPANFNVFVESNCYFLGSLVLVVKLTLNTSAEVPGSTLFFFLPSEWFLA